MSLPYGQPNVPEGFDAFGRWFERTFKTFTEYWQVWLLQGLITWGVFAVFIAIIWVIWFVFIVFNVFSTTTGSTTPPPIPWPALIITISTLIVFGVVLAILGLYLWAGMFLTAMKALRGEPVEFRDIFSAGWALPGLIGLSIIQGLIVTVGYLLCIIPGLGLSIFFMLAVSLYLTRSLGVMESLGESFSIVRRNFWLFIAFSLVMGLLIGAINQTGIGVIIGMPLTAIFHAVIINDIYPVDAGGVPPPPAPPEFGL